MSHSFRYCVSLIACVVVGTSSWAQVVQPARTRLSDASSPSSLSEARSLSRAFQAATEAILPSVVKVRTVSNSGGQRVLVGGLFPMEVPEQEGLGSGVIIDPSGIVMTNNHVVKDADEVIVVTTDGTELYGTEYVTDPLTDLAIVRVKATKPLPAARLGDSDELKIGDWVLAVGNPLELETSVSAGIISAKGRSLSKIPRAQFLQTDAAINPGNSGGPLVNLEGEVVGINTAIASQTGGYQGIGFAVPANIAKDVVRQLRDNGHVTRGYLGVSIQNLTRELSDQFVARADEQGVVVNRVNKGTPAEQAGIRPGDVITHFADMPVDSPSSLQRAVERVPVGSPQLLRFVRFGRELSAKVSTLRFDESQIERQYRSVTKKLSIPVRDNTTLGFEVADIADLARRQGYRVDKNAVLITRVARDGLAADKNLRPGMIIRQVKDRPVNNVDEFYAALRDQSLAEGVLLLIEEVDAEETTSEQFVVIRAYQ